LEEDLDVEEEGLSMYTICCTRIFINVPWADIFKFDLNYLETEEKHKATPLA